MVVGKIQPSRYKTAFKIQYMFFMTDGRNHTNAADIVSFEKDEKVLLTSHWSMISQRPAYFP